MSGGRPGLSPRIGIALALALAGCGEDGAGPGDGAVPAFTISVTGDVERELEGTAAVQGEVTEEGETFWVLALDAPLDGEAQGVIFVRAGPFPGVGQHAGTVTATGEFTGLPGAVSLP